MTTDRKYVDRRRARMPEPEPVEPPPPPTVYPMPWLLAGGKPP